MNMRNMAAWAVGILAAVLMVASTIAAPPAKLALTGAKIIPVSGPEIDGGTVLIEHGVIVAVGTDIAVPYDAMEIDLTGKVLFPGMIDPDSWRGLDVPNESIPVVPFLDVYDAIDPSRLFFEDSLRDGVTTVHVMQGTNCAISGLSRVVKPIGLSVDEMTVAPEVALRICVTPRRGADRMEQMALLRETFLKLQDDIDQLAEKKYEELLEKEGKTIDVGPVEARERGRKLLRDSDYGDENRNLVRLLRGDLGAWFYIERAMDVRHAVNLAREQGVLDTSVFVLGAETWRAIDELTEANRPVVLDPSLFHRQRDPMTGKIEEVFVPKKIHEAGLIFAIQPNAGASMAERYLTYQAAMCVRHGIPREDALSAITLNPATILGLDEKLGSIEEGKVANLVVFSGDPLDFSSWVDQVYVDGILAYDRDRDHRLKELLRLEQAAQETPPENGPPAATEESKINEADSDADDVEAPNGTESTEPVPVPRPSGDRRRRRRPGVQGAAA